MSRCPFCQVEGVRSGTISAKRGKPWITESCLFCDGTWTVPVAYGVSIAAKVYVKRTGAI